MGLRASDDDAQLLLLFSPSLLILSRYLLCLLNSRIYLGENPTEIDWDLGATGFTLPATQRNQVRVEVGQSGTGEPKDGGEGCCSLWGVTC